MATSLLLNRKIDKTNLPLTQKEIMAEKKKKKKKKKEKKTPTKLEVYELPIDPKDVRILILLAMATNYDFHTRYDKCWANDFVDIDLENRRILFNCDDDSRPRDGDYFRMMYAVEGIAATHGFCCHEAAW